MEELLGYIDSSGQERSNRDRFITVNGALATEADWIAFDQEWQDYLKNENFVPHPVTGQYVFHTSSFWARQWELMPPNLSPSAMDRINWNLLGLIDKYTRFRFGYAVLLDDFRSVETTFPHVREFVFRKPGMLMSGLCFHGNANWAEENGFSAKVNYIFDRGEEYWGDLYSSFRRDMKKLAPERLVVTSLNEADKDCCSPLQAADLIAWHCRRYFLTLNDDHFNERSPSPMPSKEFNRIHRPGKSRHVMFRQIDLIQELFIHFGSILDEIEEDLGEEIVGEGKTYSEIDDFVIDMLRNKKQTVLDRLRASRTAKK